MDMQIYMSSNEVDTFWERGGCEGRKGGMFKIAGEEVIYERASQFWKRWRLKLFYRKIYWDKKC